MSWSVIIPLIVFGLMLVLLEIFILPGLVAGIVGGLIVVFGIYQSYASYGAVAGTITLLSAIALFVILMVIFFKSGTWRKVALSDAIEGKMNTLEKPIYPGDIGISISRLAPMGKAMFGNEYVEVSTHGEFIDENTKITVIRVEGNKVFVKKTD